MTYSEPVANQSIRVACILKAIYILPESVTEQDKDCPNKKKSPQIDVLYLAHCY